MSVSLIGLHMNTNGINQFPARVVLSLNGNGLDEQHPDTLILFRDTTIYNDGPPDLHTHPLRRTVEYAGYWYDRLRPIWQANAHRAHYFCITNELGGNDAEHIQDHIAFEANICQLAYADGLRCVVGKLAGDTPGWPSGLWQQYYAPHIMQSWNRYRALYGRHVYGGDLVDGGGNPTHDPPGNPARILDEIAHLRSLGYNGGIVLAECGLDGGQGTAVYGRFRTQALGYAAALRPHADLLIGLCWWKLGGSGANYTQHLSNLRSDGLDTSLPKWQPAIQLPKIVIVKKPQKANMTLVQNQQIGEWCWNNYGRTNTHSTDDCLQMLRGGNDESYAVIPYPDQQQDDIATIEAAGFAWRPMDNSPLSGLRLAHILPYRYVLTSPFDAPRDYGRHEGADYDVIGGQVNNTTPVLCAYPGVVDISIDSTGGYGKYVRVRHERFGSTFYTYYCHLDARYVVVNQQLQAGTAVGEIGATGNADGEHVHFNLRVPGFGLSGYVIPDVVNPEPYMALGRDALPNIPTGNVYDLAAYIIGGLDGRAVQLSSGETLQYQSAGNYLYLVKNSQWEQLRFDGQYINRGKDTSPGPAPSYAERPGALRWYWQREPGRDDARWCPRFMTIGQNWQGAQHYVQFYYKDNCAPSAANSGYAVNRANLVMHYTNYSWGNITMQDAIEYSNGAGETFWFARGWGMVAWTNGTDEGHVIELFQPGQRQLTRETGCFS